MRSTRDNFTINALSNALRHSVAAACLLAAAALQAQPATGDSNDQCGCNPALAKDVLTSMNSEQLKYSYFSEITENTFTQIKHDASASASIPLLPDMISILKASASYSDFQENRRLYFAKIGYSVDAQREQRDVQVVTSPIAYSSWTQCKLNCTETGVYAFKTKEDATTVYVTIRNNTATPIKITAYLQHLKAVSALPTRLGANGTRSVTLARTGNKGTTSSITLNTDPAYDPPPVTSVWGDAPPAGLTGTLKLTTPLTHREDRGKVDGPKFTTPNYDNVGYDPQKCSVRFDRWCGGSTVLYVSAEQPTWHLDSPTLSCDQTGACTWGADTFTATCHVLQPDNQAMCDAKFASGVHVDWAEARQYEIVSNPTIADQPVLLFSQSQFVLKVPTDATSAIFQYQLPGGGTGTITPGDAASSDGALILLGHNDATDGKYYTYRTTR
jgi:hypothetical protein